MCVHVQLTRSTFDLLQVFINFGRSAHDFYSWQRAQYIHLYSGTPSCTFLTFWSYGLHLPHTCTLQTYHAEIPTFFKLFLYRVCVTAQTYLFDVSNERIERPIRQSGTIEEEEIRTKKKHESCSSSIHSRSWIGTENEIQSKYTEIFLIHWKLNSPFTQLHASEREVKRM